MSWAKGGWPRALDEANLNISTREAVAEEGNVKAEESGNGTTAKEALRPREGVSKEEGPAGRPRARLVVGRLLGHLGEGEEGRAWASQKDSASMPKMLNFIFTTQKLNIVLTQKTEGENIRINHEI